MGIQHREQGAGIALMAILGTGRLVRWYMQKWTFETLSSETAAVSP
jgi:hypothetical protein